MISLKWKLIFFCVALLQEKGIVEGLDECAQGSDSCHKNAKCTDKPEGYDCDCKSGFTGNGFQCADLDECATEVHTCGSSQCINTVGAYSCSCGPGLEWNSRSKTCIDINECSLNRDECSNLATCSNTHGSYVCKCISGYTGNGRECSDLNECSAGVHRCENNNACINKIGTYACNCRTGFQWNPSKMKCKDVNECNSKTDNCSTLANCANTNGTFLCNCVVGFTGNGYNCTGPSPCPISLYASFLLNTAANYRDFNKQKTFLKLTAAKFIVANGNRLSVSVYRDTTLHHITLTASKDNKDFANRVDKLYLFNGEYRLDLALNSVLDEYYRPGQASLKAKVIVLVVGHKLVRSPDLCESYIQPYELASKLKVAGVRVIMAVIGVNASEFSKEIVDSDDEVWYFANYDELVSSARDFSVAICRTAARNLGTPQCSSGGDYCQANAECIKEGNIYRCQCKAGFSKNGAVCVSSVCPVGYAKQGGICQDINECAPNSNTLQLNCSQTGDCLNTVGSYACFCKKGFVKDGSSCVDNSNNRGGVYREFYASTNGDTVEDLLRHSKFPNNPDYVEILKNFDVTLGVYDSGYGQRLSAYYVPSSTGLHIFFMSCATSCELWISGDDSERNMTRIIKLEPWEFTAYQQWNKYPGKQVSRSLQLSSGQPYLLRVYMKAGSGIQTGHVSVGVQTPSGVFERPLSNRTLEYYHDFCASRPDYCQADSECINRFHGPDCTCVPGFYNQSGTCGAPEQCPVPVSVTFLVDTSINVLSSENFEKQKLLIQGISSRFNVTNVGGIKIIPYSDLAHLSRIFQIQQNKTFGEFAERMRDLQYLRGGCCRYDLALEKGHSDIQTQVAQANVQNVIVLLASGMTPTNVHIGNTAAVIKEAKILTFAVGIGDSVRSSDLKTIATDSSKAFTFANFDSLAVNDIYKDICRSTARSADVIICPTYALVTYCQDHASCVQLNDSSYRCVCDTGFVENGSLCLDVNECLDGSHSCDKIATCINTLGSYQCQCPSGYRLNGSRCDDINECLSSRTYSCHNKADCVNTNGSYNCVCKSGLSGNGKTLCSDINECSFIPYVCHKDAQCKNVERSYHCACVSGYSGNGTKCTAPEKCRVPVDLFFAIDASGSVKVDNYEKQKEFIKILASRYDLENSSRAAVIVFSSKATNVITLGTKNTTLSFANAVDNIPYDQALTRVDLAMDLIYNTYFGSRNSNETQRLVILLTDGKQTRNNYMSPAYIPIEGTVQLLRSKGARMFAVGIGSSVDITEMRLVTEQEDDIFLSEGFNDLIAKSDVIAKTTCAVALRAEGISVCSADVDITSCHFGADCVNKSNNFSCLCRPGFVGDFLQCEDIDECAIKKHDCPANAYCVNAAGSYYCSCNETGYRYDSNSSTCVDIDECAPDWDACDPTKSVCVNTPGSFYCACPDNYAWNGQSCVDVDECAYGSHECHPSTICVNSVGSYNCTCNETLGYIKNGSMCLATDRCAERFNECPINSYCINTVESYDCICNQSGFTFNGSVCLDVDECVERGRCAENATCTNLDGSYDCTCSAVESHFCFGSFFCDKPRAKITNIGRTIENPSVVHLSSLYTFKAEIELRCGRINSKNVSWIIADPSWNDTHAIKNGTVLWSNASDWSLTENHIALAHVLHALYLSVIVIQRENQTEKVYDRGYFKIRLSPLVAVIAGETEITRGNKQSFILNGSESYDPHAGPGKLETLKFHWLCRKSHEVFPTENLLEIKIVPIPLNSTNGTSGGCFGTGIGKLETTESVVVLNASVMDSLSTSYVFKLVITKDARSSSDAKTVHVVDGDPPQVSMNFVLNDRLNVIPSAPLTIAAEYVGSSCDDSVKYMWLLFKEDINSKEWTIVVNNSVSSSVLAIQPNILEDNTVYRLELAVQFANGTASTTIQVFKTAELPRDGTCSITPDSGEAVYTSFEMVCSGWFAANETFIYEVQLRGSGDINYILSHGVEEKHQFVLPQGDANRGYLYDVKVFILRSNGATSEKEIPVTVTPPETREQKDLFVLLEKNLSSFEAHLNSMNPNKALQLMTAMLLTVESQESANSGSSNSTVSTKQRTNLRDVALKRFQLKEIDALPSLVFMSAFLASAGRNVTELSFYSKDVLPEILANMSNTLHSVAENMLARDERFISQGTYNLLYGTVELLLVSAEKSAVTGGSGTASADQLKTREVVVKTINIMKTLLRTLASRTAISESAKELQVPGLQVTLGRETPCGLAKKDLKTPEGQEFTLPDNIKYAFGNTSVEWVEYHMTRTAFNPYKWHESHKQIKSQILSLDFTNDKGEEIPIRGNNLKIDIGIPLNSAVNTSNNFFVRPLTMRYHTVQLENRSDSMIVEVEPINSTLMMIVYVRRGERPTTETYDHFAVVPDHTFCSWVDVNGSLAANCTRSPYAIMTTEDFNETGVYFLGIFYVEKDKFKLNHTRTKRSCFGRRRQKRDCVEPKPPPVKGVIPNRTLIYNPALDQNYSIKVRKYSCYYFKLTQDEWRKDGCQVGDETNDKLLQCHCNHLTSFGGGFVIAPNPLDLDKIFTEFTRLGETGNYLVLSVVCSIFGAYILLIIWARKADLQDQSKLGPTVDVKIAESGSHKYNVAVVTGVWRNAGTTASVFMTIYGTEGTVEAVNLTKCSPPGRKMFGRGSISTFVFHLEKSLGTVIKIETWHDNSGKNGSWFLDQIRIIERGSGEKWDFFHHEWLAVHLGDGSTKVTLKSNDPCYHGPGFKNLFYSMSSVDLADYHLWASVMTRPPRNPFTRVQRASCCLCLLYLAMACNAMFYEVTGASSDVIELGPLKMSIRQVIIGVQSALIVAPVSLVVTGLFRRRKAKMTPRDKSKRSPGEDDRPEGSKWKQPWLLPYPFVYVGWFVCIVAAASSATITVFYSLQWGKDISDQWMASVVVSLVKDVFIWQPVKVLTFTLVLILIFKRPKSPDDEDTYYGSSFSEEMKELREYELQKSKFFGCAREFVAFMVFYVLLMIVAYGNKGYDRYLMNEATRDGFRFFDEVDTGDKMWIYMLGNFIHDSYAGEWYNGQWEQTTEYIGNKVSMLAGMPRLRQLRIQEDSCMVVKELQPWIDKCYDFYSMSEEDTTRLYLPHWIPLSESQLAWKNLTELCPRPWRYSTAKELNNFPSMAQHHFYDGGGYVLDLGYDQPTAIRMMEGVKDKDWIDRRTRAVLLEFQVLNLNTNLMSIVTYHYEVLPFGFGLTWERIDTIKIFNFQSLSFGFYLTCQILFLLVVLLYIAIILIRLYRQGCAFFKAGWNWIDIGQIISATFAIVFYVIKSKFMHDSISKLRENPFLTVSFHFAILWTDMENLALSAALFIATFKILRFIRLNPHVQMLVWTILSAKSDIFSFCVIFGIVFVAHAHLAYLAFGGYVYSFSSFLRSFASEFELSLGNTNHIKGLNNVNGVLGPMFATSFMVSLAILLVNIFISILDISLHEVKEDEERVKEAFGMGEFVRTLLFGFRTGKKNDNNDESLEFYREFNNLYVNQCSN